MKKLTKIITFCLVLLVGYTFVCPTQVTEVQAATVKISKTKATITEGYTLQLKMLGTKKTAKWSSDKKSVATVTTKGKVTAKKVGTATITAKIGAKKYTCKVTVSPNYKKKILGTWQGKWADEEAEFQFYKNGMYFFQLYGNRGLINSTHGIYAVKGNQLKLDTGETYKIKSITSRYLTLVTYFGTYKLEKVVV